ncbi:MAG TPA: polyprenyl synthetase family protein [Tissierellia bacterium]|nr:polyprenyl synthetase family protein [Tissierellia bacterium]
MRGKMLRPLLSLIGAEIAKTQRDLVIATSLEMLHIGTLIHDDVIDESKLRRGKESIQSKYSKEYAIYLGDYLFSSLFVYLSGTGIDKSELVGLAKLMQQICLAEMKQWHHRYNTDQSVREYLRIISGKTAALFSLALGSAAKEPPLKQKLQRIGYHLGMAFQIQDDLLDFEGDEALVGKELQKDLLIGNYNLPILFALEEEPERMRRLLSTQTDLSSEIRQLVMESAAYDRTRQLLNRYFDKIDQAIVSLPGNQGRQDLQELIGVLRSRAY